MAKSDTYISTPKDLESEVLNIIDEEITQGTSFANDIGQLGHDEARTTAMDYYRGIMRDVPADPDWSHAVSRDVSNTIDATLPGLMRVFAGAGQIASFSPENKGDEQNAAFATEYVNYLWDNELNGYLVLHTAVHDALLVRNGVMKVYWDSSPEYETEDVTGLSAAQVALLQQQPDVHIQVTGEEQQPYIDPMTGQPGLESCYAARVWHVKKNGEMKLEGVPPEDFGISSGARSIDDARMVWHIVRQTRSDLIRMGIPKDVVDDLPSWMTDPQRDVDRELNTLFINAPTANHSMQEVDVYECYMMYDADGDGIAERYKILAAGPNGARQLLSMDPWPDDVPFVDLTPYPVPHRWMGRSLADEVMDIQRIKTVVLREMLNNVYLTNRPQRYILENAINNPDEVLNPKIGGVIRGKVAGAIETLETPYIGDKAMAQLNYQDGIIAQRTGISQATMALDATALDPQTATAEQIEHDSSYSRVELIARNMAELGLKKLFQKVLRILVRHQDRERSIRLRGQWVDMDPRSWNANMDASINVGLGTGSRERDLAMLGGISKQQDLVVQQLGPNNPVVTPSMWVATRHKMVEAAGLKNADEFFAPISDQQYTQWQSQQQPPPDPKIQLEQAKAQASNQKDQAKLQISHAKNVMSAQSKGQAEAAKIQLEAAKTQGEVQTKAAKAQADVALDAYKAQMDNQRRWAELDMERQLKQQELKIKANAPGVTELRNPE
jgi:hypothetical protein